MLSTLKISVFVLVFTSSMQVTTTYYISDDYILIKLEEAESEYAPAIKKVTLLSKKDNLVHTINLIDSTRTKQDFDSLRRGNWVVENIQTRHEYGDDVQFKSLDCIEYLEYSSSKEIKQFHDSMDEYQTIRYLAKWPELDKMIEDKHRRLLSFYKDNIVHGEHRYIVKYYVDNAKFRTDEDEYQVPDWEFHVLDTFYHDTLEQSYIDWLLRVEVKNDD